MPWPDNATKEYLTGGKDFCLTFFNLIEVIVKQIFKNPGPVPIALIYRLIDAVEISGHPNFHAGQSRWCLTRIFHQIHLSITAVYPTIFPSAYAVSILVAK